MLSKIELTGLRRQKDYTMKRYTTKEIAKLIGKSHDYVIHMMQVGVWGIDRRKYEKYGNAYALTYEQALEIVSHYGSDCIANLQKTQESV